MLELTAYGARRRVKGAIALAVAISLFSLLYVGFFPSLASNVDLQQYVDSLPSVFVEAFGLRAFGTIEGYLATELYHFAWVILFGVYLAYSAAGLLASDVESGRIDVLLSLPVPRRRLVAEKYLALAPGILLVNVVVGAVTWAGTRVIGFPVAISDVIAVHALSLPYLFTCAGIGLACSVVASRASIAQRAAMGLTFGLFLVESLVTGTDYAWAGAIAPSRYYDPTAILVDGQYDLAGAAILTAAAVLLVAASGYYFARRDVN